MISESEVLDEEAAVRYRAIAAQAIEQYGGRYVVRGAVPEAVEGEWPARRRLIIVEFPSLEQARTWYESPEYAEARKIADTAMDRSLTFVEGLPG